MRFEAASRIARVVELATVDSTLDLVDDTADDLTTWATLDQRAGRGRLGRIWTAPAGKCLSAAILVRRELEVEQLGWLPLAAGLAVVDAIDPLVGDRAGVKWPNDVLIDGKKVAGILCERRPGGVAIGIGVNLTLTPDERPVETATSLAIEGAEGTAAALADAVLARVLANLQGLLAQLGTPALRDAVEAELTTIGREVRAEIAGSAPVVGRAVRLGEDGELEIETADGSAAVRAGDVIHLR